MPQSNQDEHERSTITSGIEDSNENDVDAPVSFRHSNLVDVRNRLLDLTARNRLLNRI